MSRVALISDIHGNAVALDAVLAELATAAVDEIVCLGDVAAGGPRPREVVGRLRELDCRAVRGNADGWLLDGFPPDASDETRRLGEVVTWARKQLAPADLDYLAALPATAAIAVADDLTLFCFHGSPRAAFDRLLATTPERELDELFGGAPEARVLAGGHTHLQLLRPYRQGLLVNPGSVGLPLGSLRSSAGAPDLPARAEYALVDFGRDDLEVAFRRVPIDVGQLAVESAAMPHATWAADLERRIGRRNARAAA